MALKYYRHKETDKIIRSLSRKDPDIYEEVIKAPNGKFMICANAAKGSSKLKDSKAVLTERARNHTRDTLLDETIQINKDNKIGTAQNFLNETGKRRTKLDDI